MDKKKHKSGSLKRKEREEADRKRSAKFCKSITRFIVTEPPSTLISISKTSNEDEKTCIQRDDAMTYEIDEQRSISQDTVTNTGESSCQTSSSISASFTPLSVKTVIPAVTSPDITTSPGDMELNAPSTKNLVTEKDNAKESTQQLERSGPGIFQYPLRTNLKQFFAEHPVQPLNDLPFDARLYERKTMNDTVQRKWLTYNKENKSLYCSYCLAFEFPNNCNVSPFVLGFNDYRRISQSLALHESTATHSKNAQKYISVVKGETLDNFLTASINKKKEEVRNQRSIVMRIIDIIKMLSKQALPFRGHRNESAYTLDNDTLNHGNFLATVKLMAKYDTVMASHVSSVQHKSEQRIKRLEKQGKAESKGRGGLVTYLSKTTVNTLLQIIRNMIQEVISKEVSSAGYYSIQVDSTQDITSIDQFSIIIRYVYKGSVCERLLSVVPSNDGTGQGLFDLLFKILENHKIDPTKCISDSTDGAASYHGQYKGLQKKLCEHKTMYIFGVMPMY